MEKYREFAWLTDPKKRWSAQEEIAKLS